MAAHLKNVRAGQNGRVTLKLTELETALGATPVDEDQLEQFRVTLPEKFNLLRRLTDDIIAELQDDTEIVEACEEFTDSIRLAFFRIKMEVEYFPSTLTYSNSFFTKSSFCAWWTSSRMKLPRLTLTPFDCNYTKWYTFWDSYKSAVHNDPRLPYIVKFNYLQSLLQKTAMESIAGLSLTAASYKEAINILFEKILRKVSDYGQTYERTHQWRQLLVTII
uniref:Uncharacterized protein n=1 Tax=Amphimedon queenslandica TaxID=400682 RepID=A0A1X7UT25_AMPQE